MIYSQTNTVELSRRIFRYWGRESQVASVCALLSAPKREKLLSGLKLDNLSMADVQSLLHWANNRQCSRFQPIPSKLSAAALLPVKMEVQQGCEQLRNYQNCQLDLPEHEKRWASDEDSMTHRDREVQLNAESDSFWCMRWSCPYKAANLMQNCKRIICQWFHNRKFMLMLSSTQSSDNLPSH